MLALVDSLVLMLLVRLDSFLLRLVFAPFRVVWSPSVVLLGVTDDTFLETLKSKSCTPSFLLGRWVQSWDTFRLSLSTARESVEPKRIEKSRVSWLSSPFPGSGSKGIWNSCNVVFAIFGVSIFFSRNLTGLNTTKSYLAFDWSQRFFLSGGLIYAWVFQKSVEWRVFWNWLKDKTTIRQM